jgi:plastocyanin
MLFSKRKAVTKMQGVIVVVVVLVAVVAAGAYVLSSGRSQPSSNEIDLAIIESDPVNQVDSFNPANITAVHGTTVNLAVNNGDDAARTFEISALNVNQTIGSGETVRMTLTMGQPGAYKMFVPATPPSNGLKASPSITGYLIVT